MAYCTLADLPAPEEDLIQLTDDAGTGAPVAAIIDQFIAVADELVDGYLRGRYPLPLTPTPGIIKVCSADIALYRLYGRRAHVVAPKDLADRYKNALKILENIQKGSITLPGATSADVRPHPGAASFVSPARTFSRESLRDY